MIVLKNELKNFLDSTLNKKIPEKEKEVEKKKGLVKRKERPIQGSEETQDKSSTSEQERMKLKSLKEIEIEAIKETLISTKYNMSKASKILGVSRMTLYRKIETYGLDDNE